MLSKVSRTEIHNGSCTIKISYNSLSDINKSIITQTLIFPKRLLKISIASNGMIRCKSLCQRIYISKIILAPLFFADQQTHYTDSIQYNFLETSAILLFVPHRYCLFLVTSNTLSTFLSFLMILSSCSVSLISKVRLITAI